MRNIRTLSLPILLKLLIGFTFISITPSTFGQIAKERLPELVPYRVGKKWGFSDSNGNLVIEPKYDEIVFLNTNLFKVKFKEDWMHHLNAKWGVVNKKGKLIHPCIYSSIDYFIPDNTHIKLSLYDYNKYGNDGKQGIIDSLGNFLVPPKHTYSYPLRDDLFEAVDYNLDKQGNTKNKYGIYRKGKIIIPFKYDKIEENELGQIFLIKGNNINSENGNITSSRILKVQRNSVSLEERKHYYTSAFIEGLATIYHHSDNTYQFVNKKEKLAFNRKFKGLRLNDKNHAFCNGLASVSEDGNLFGYIDKQGQTIIPFEFHTAMPFKDGLAIVKKADKFGIIDTRGNVIEPFIYRSLNWRGDLIIEGSNDTASFRKGYFNPEGYRTPIKYSYIHPFNNGFALVQKNNKASEIYGYINKKGQEIIPLIYQAGYGFSEGLAAVKKEGKWGFIDSTGKVIIPFKFLQASIFKYGRAAVSIKKNTWIYIDQKGNKVSEKIIYDDNFSPNSEYFPPLFYKGFVPIITRWQEKVNDKGILYRSPIYRVINDKGKRITEKEYTHVSTEALDFGLIYVCDDNGCGFLDTKGQIFIPLDYHFEQENNIYAYGPFLQYGLLKAYTPDKRNFLGFMSITGKKYWKD